MPLSRSQAAAKGEKVAELPKTMGALDMQLQQRSTPQKGKFPVRTTSKEEETDEFDDLEIDEDGGDSQEHPQQEYDPGTESKEEEDPWVKVQAEQSPSHWKVEAQKEQVSCTHTHTHYCCNGRA